MLDGGQTVRQRPAMEDTDQPGAAGAARMAIIALNAWIAIEILVIVTGLDFVAGGGYDVWFATPPIVALAKAIELIALIPVAVVILFWFYRVMAVAHRLTAGLTISPGGAVGWFFVPVASLWKPYEAMVQIVEGSSPNAVGRRKPVRDLIFWWWGAWIGRYIVAIFLRFAHSDDGLTSGMVILTIGSAALGIAAAVALQTIIRGVRRMQDSHVDASIFD
jgi:hypothetical protein